MLAGLFRTHAGFLHAETPPAPSFRGLPQSPHSITPFTTGLGLFMPGIIGFVCGAWFGAKVTHACTLL